MHNLRTLFLILLVAASVIWLAACTGDTAEQPAMETPTSPATEPAEEVADEPATPTVIAATAAPAEEVAGQEPALNGQLYYVGFVDQEQHLLRLDLATGQETSLLTVSESAWLSEVTVSPDGDRLLLAYAPPPEQNQVQFGFTTLHIMPANGSGEPELLVPQDDPSETFYNISWPLEDLVYYARYAPSVDDAGAVTYVNRIERAHLPDANVEVLVNDAAWPRLANDGSRLAYVAESGEMMMANADGTSPQLVLESDVYAAVDAPLFSPDGEQLYYSAVDREPGASLSPLDKLLGVKIARAHSVPSDWWRLSSGADQERQRLTTIDKIGLYGDFSADGRHLYFVAADGLYVMDPADQTLTQLQAIPTVATIDWTP